jgi:hypothetical protein
LCRFSWLAFSLRRNRLLIRVIWNNKVVFIYRGSALLTPSRVCIDIRTHVQHGSFCGIVDSKLVFGFNTQLSTLKDTAIALPISIDLAQDVIIVVRFYIVDLLSRLPKSDHIRDNVLVCISTFLTGEASESSNSEPGSALEPFVAGVSRPFSLSGSASCTGTRVAELGGSTGSLLGTGVGWLFEGLGRGEALSNAGLAGRGVCSAFF